MTPSSALGDVDIVQPDAGSSDDDEILAASRVGPSTWSPSE